MITNLVILVVLGLIVVIAVFNKEIFSTKLRGDAYVEKMAKFLEVPLERPDGPDGLSRVSFVHEGRKFVYEHVPEEGMEKDVIHRGYLRAPTTDDHFMFRLGEQVRSTLRSNVSSLNDIVNNPWGKDADRVILPSELQEFELTTTNVRKARALLSDPEIVRLFVKFKNRDSRGRPVMALEVHAGTLVLQFNPPGGVSPNVLEIQANVSEIEEFVAKLAPLAARIDQLRKEFSG